MADYTDLQDVSYHSSRNLYVPCLRQTICEYFLSPYKSANWFTEEWRMAELRDGGLCV